MPFTSGSSRKEEYMEKSVSNRRTLITSSVLESITVVQDPIDIEELAEVYVVIEDFDADDENAISVRQGEVVEVVDTGGTSPAKRIRLDENIQLLDTSAAKHKLAIRPKRKHVDSRQKASISLNSTRWLIRTLEGNLGRVPCKILQAHPSGEPQRPEDAKYKREAVVRELVETEEEFGRDLQYVVEHYLKPLDSAQVPRIVRDNIDVIFSNFKQIANFHNTVLIEGVKYYANEPRMIGKTFLRLERDFDKHVAYCRDEVAAQEFLSNTPIAKEFFEDLSQRLNDDKSLSEHLKLPIQRIHDYQLLLKELVKYSNRLGETTDDLQRALDLMLAVPHRANDNKFISNIEGYHGNIHKLGRLLRHDWWTVTDRDHKSKERYLFLFKARILICKVKRISEDRSVFVLKDIIKIPEIEIKDCEHHTTFELIHKDPNTLGYPLTVSAHHPEVKVNWLREIRKYASDALALQEHVADDLRIQDDTTILKNAESDLTSELKTQLEAKLSKVAKRLEESSVDTRQIIEEQSQITKNLGAIPSTNPAPPQKEKQPSCIVETVSESLPSVKEPITQEPLINLSGKQEQSSTEVPKGQDKPSVEVKTVALNQPEKQLPEEVKPLASLPLLPAIDQVPSTPNEKVIDVKLTKEPNIADTKEQQISVSNTKLEKKVISVSPEANKNEMAYSQKSSSKYVEESYSVSSYREETIIQQNNQYSSVQQTSSTSYSSSGVDAAGGQSALTITEITHEKPIFVRTLTGLQRRPGFDAAFECQLASAVESVTWLKDNRALDDRLADRVVKSSTDDFTHRLEIQHLMEKDSGIYTCIAKNGDYSSTCTAQLLVTEVSDEEKERLRQANAPEFSVRLKDTELLQGTNFRFMIKVQGNPNPDVKFFKDGQPINTEGGRVIVIDEKKDKGFYELVIADVQAEDTGKYSCVAKNKFGEVTCDGRVTVTDAKKVFAGLESSEVLPPGEKPLFSWLRDGKPFDPEERFKVLLGNEEDSLALVFQHVKPEDAGLYTCVASTSTGRISCSAELSVQGTVSQLAREPEKPQCTTEYRESEATVGGTAMLEAKIFGFPKPDIQWFHEGEEVKPTGRLKFLFEDQESMTLVIKNVTPEDAGTYKIVAKNELGEDKTELKLVVKGPPKFRTKFEETEVILGEQLKLTSKIDAVPAADVKWYKDGKEVTQNNRLKLIQEDKFYSLIVDKSELSDCGSYSIVATNVVGQSSDFVAVKVNAAPKVLKAMEKKVEISEGQKITFQIQVEAEPPPEVKWKKDGVEIKGDGVKYNMSSDHGTLTLHVYETDRNDSGDYSVEIKNQLGHTVDQGRADVKCEPMFKVGLKDTVVQEGDSDVVLNVNINAYPKPSIKWYLGDVEITEKKNEYERVDDGDDHKLIIKEATRDVHGKYTCKVINELGSKDSSAHLSVHCKPKILKSLPPKTEVDENAELTLEVECYGCPEPEIKWLKNGQEVRADAHIKIIRDSHRSESYSLTLNLVKGVDSGDYEFVATNSLGTESTKTKVVVYTKTTEKTIEVIEEITTEEAAQTVKEAEVTKSAAPVTVEGTQDSHEILEIKKTTVLVSEDDSPSVLVEELGSYSLQEKTAFSFSSGIVEEYSDNEDHKNLSVDRGVSIISLSEDEGLTLSRNDSGTNVLIESKIDTDGNVFYKRESSLKEESELEQAEDEIEDKNERRNGESGRKTGGDADDDDDPEVQALLNRIKKQRSVLEEILSNKKTDEGESPLKESASAVVFDGGEQFIEKTELEDVTVEAFPQISNHDLEQRTIFESLSTSYFVEASGIPRPEASWYKDGTLVQSDDRIKITDEGQTYRLEINDLVMADAGVYKCKIHNRLGEKSVEAKLNLTSVNEYRKPVFKKPLTNLKIPKNEPTVLQCIIVGDPIPDIVWLHNEKEVALLETQQTPPRSKYARTPLKIDAESDTKISRVDVKEIENHLFECTFTLTIPDSLHQDTGTYKIKAKNIYGEAESSARLDVILKPEIEHLKDATAIPYENAEFSCNVYSNPPCTVRWLNKSGTLVANNEHTIITEDKANEFYKLRFVNIGLGDAGYYTVVAKNDVGETTHQVHLTVHTEAPTIVKMLDDKKVNDYEDVKFHIRFNGVPKVQVKWLKNGEEIVSSERVKIETSEEGQIASSLSISHFGVNDIGQYTAVGSNLVGSAESKANLRMTQLPPSFGKALSRLEELNEGDTLDLKCRLDGSPIPKVAWYKDGEPIDTDHHLKITVNPDGSVRLLIEDVRPTDCGAYKLVAENPNGSTAAICAVAVKPKPCVPTILKGLEDSNDIVNEPLKLEATIMAFPAPEVKWFKDGQPIRPSQAINFINQPGGNIGLIIDALKLEDAGVYSVKVTNKLGEATSEATIQVSPRERRPTFESHLMPVKVVEGFPAKLEVKVSGHPKPLVKWTHKGQEVIPDGERIKLIEYPDGTVGLLIAEATHADGGEWAAVALNDKGELSSKAELTVSDKKIPGEPECRPEFLHPLREISVEEGTPLIISAPFIGNPIPDVTWTKDEYKVWPDERTLLTCDGKKVGVDVRPAKVTDSGLYTCHLVNPLGETTNQVKVVVKKIYSAPTFTQKFTDTQQLPTYVAKFPARIIGIPRPEVEWFFNGDLIHESDKYHIKRDGDACCLYVRDCNVRDSGQYRCRARNREGAADCVAHLDVVDEIKKQTRIEPPSFLKKLGDCEVYKGMTARFTACISGIPEPDFEWYRNGDKMYQNDRVRMDRETNGLLRLTIAGVDLGDVGRYRLRIFNPHGEASSEAELLYEALDSKPKKPIGDQYVDYDKFRSSGVPLPLSDKPIISRMTDRHLTLSWKPSIPHGPRVPVTYLVEMAEQPDGDWFTARSGIRSCACDIRNLEPFRDYKFRVRVENKYGVSDPSPFAVTFRQKLEPDPPKFVPFLSPGIDFRPETSPYFPKDFDIEKPPHDGYAQAPKFLRQEHDTQYGVKNHNCNLFWFVYGYPKPKMSYYFNDEPIEMGGRFDCSYTRNGQATLFINKMLDRDVGTYEAVATNEHGEARQRVRLDIAEYPTFIQRPDETIIMMRKAGRITARVTGVPYPDIKWYKDWQPLAPSSRIKIKQIPPDTVVLILNDAIQKDEGLYSVSARNVAGSVSSSAMVHIEESEQEYAYITYGRGRNVKPKTKPLTDFYDLGDELGRGTQGVTYHAVERLTGRNYAAKVMHGRSELRPYMLNELDILNSLNHRKLIRLQDSFEGRDSLILVLELAGGGELLETLTKQTFTTETEIATYIRQILWGLEYLHTQDIAHLSLTIGDLLLSHPGGDDLKICDFGLARRIPYGKLSSLDYGMPEFVSPEIVNSEGVSFPADMWSLGIITYILLSGVSPFKGENDRDTLTRIREGKWEFDEQKFCNISAEARDFIKLLLVYQAEGRMDARTALKHPWLDVADKIPVDQFNITTDSLKSYFTSFKDWYSNASCRTWYRRRPLSGAFSHPSRMVYPPGHKYTPEPEGSPKGKIGDHEVRTWEQSIPGREPLDYEISEFTSESHYQNGPDTYLLQLRDVDLPCRLRHYMKVAANRQSGFSIDAQDKHIDWRTPVIRERRRFTDIMDEEIDDERKARINKYGSSDVYSLRRLRHEFGTRSGGHAEAEAMLEYKREGQIPFFREKPQLLAILDDHPAEMTCLAVGDPKPTIQWFKNDLVVVENSRVKMLTDEEGRSYLKFLPALHVDVGIYKAVARNKVGQTVARTRIVVASTPSSPDSPEATEMSDTEILIRWKQPKDDGHSPVLCYSLQYKEADNIEWITIANNIDHEFWLVKNLKPLTNYVFRLSARNAIGWSDKGIPTALIKTKETGAAKILISRAMRHLQAHTENGAEITPEESKLRLDYSIESKPIEITAETNISEKYSFVSEVSRGQFSIVAKGIEKNTDQYVAAKLFEVKPETEEDVAREFENIRSFRHERIVTLLAAIRPAPSIAVLIMEKLQGADILTYFTSRHEYSEQMVVTVITQILDGLQYLHWRGLCHLNIQPDNVVLSSLRSLQIKLVDFGWAQRVSKLGTVVNTPPTDYTAPEVLAGEPAYPQTDIWSLGVLTYILLSGVSPFRGDNSEETRQNIMFVRYRFEYLYSELTQEATRFLMLLFKRAPNKRPTVEECYEHRWLMPTEFMIKKRERALFLGNRLKEYSDFYHSDKSENGQIADKLMSIFGERGHLARTNSIQDELTATATF